MMQRASARTVWRHARVQALPVRGRYIGAAVAVTTQSDRRLLDAVEDVRTHGGPVRAWVVGEAALQSDIEVERAGLGWPPR